jgi:soluble lytic murein transglycosylase-like protein
VGGAVAIAALSAVGLAHYSSSSTDGYTVRAGDTLWAIASDHGVTVGQLAAANGLNPADILPIGKVLVMPGHTHQAQPNAAPAQVSAWSWCSTFQPRHGPWGQLPSNLTSATYRSLSPLFDEWAAHYGVSRPLLEALAWQESGWQQSVVSPTGAVGVGQVEPYTASFIEADIVGIPLNLHSVSDNIRMSAAFLGYLAHVEGGNTCETVAAYYEGPLNLQAVGVLPSAQQYVADVEYLESRFE